MQIRFGEDDLCIPCAQAVVKSLLLGEVFQGWYIDGEQERVNNRAFTTLTSEEKNKALWEAVTLEE